MGITAPVLYNRNPLCHRKRFLNMQVAFFTVFSNPSIVIYPVGHIGVLLNLCDQDVFSDCMDGPGLDKKYVSLLHRHGIQHFGKGIIHNSVREFLSTDLSLETIVQERILTGVHNIPHFGLAVLRLILPGVPVVRMYLYGQVIPCINKFDQDREILKPVTMCTQFPCFRRTPALKQHIVLFRKAMASPNIIFAARL